MGLQFVIAISPAAGLSGGGASDYDEAWLEENPEKLAWQSKLVLLAVLPFAGTGVLLHASDGRQNPLPW